MIKSSEHFDGLTIEISPCDDDEANGDYMAHIPEDESFACGIGRTPIGALYDLYKDWYGINIDINDEPSEV